MTEQVTATPGARATGDGRLAHLRGRGERAGEVRPIELFFDLVYVLAVTQLTRHLVANLTLRGALETLILLLAVWGAWNHIAWITNYFDLRARAARLVLIGLMLASLIMSSSLFGAFGDHGLAFAGALSASLLGGQVFAFAAVPRRDPLTAVFARVVIWWIPVCLLLITGGLVDGDGRIALWLSALAVLYVVTGCGFPLPRLGRSRTTDYTDGGRDHRRCRGLRVGDRAPRQSARRPNRRPHSRRPCTLPRRPGALSSGRSGVRCRCPGWHRLELFSP